MNSRRRLRVTCAPRARRRADGDVTMSGDERRDEREQRREVRRKVHVHVTEHAGVRLRPRGAQCPPATLLGQAQGVDSVQVISEPARDLMRAVGARVVSDQDLP